MINTPNTDPDALQHRALAHPLRLRLLRLLEAAGPLDVRTLGERLGLRPNGVRRHLDLLLRADLVSATAAQATSRPGRPRLVYQVAAAPRERVSYRLLADMLAHILAGLDNTERPEEEGRRWGRLLVERSLPPGPLHPDEATVQLTAMLDRLGFAPRATTTAEGVCVELHRCPFLETAKVYPDVVCSLHLGLIRGALAELDAPLHATQLDQLVQPDLCLAHLRRTD